MNFFALIFCVAAAAFTSGEITNPKAEDVPYLVSIRSSDDKNICIGAIIKANLVIAPLNCIQSDDISVYAGTIDPESTSTEGIEVVKVKEIDRRIFGRGIRVAAFLTLEKDLTLTNNVKIIKFLKENPKEGDKVTINGFGVDLEKNNEPIKKLTSIKSQVTKYEDCFKAQSLPTYNEHLFCVDQPENKSETCKVYGPSTLLICNSGGEDVLCGLAFGNGYCIDNEIPKLTFLKSSAADPSKYDI